MDRRLPLLIALLLVSAIAALAVGAYGAVERTLLAAAESRLQASARQLASLLSASAAERRTEAAAIAADPDVRRHLTEPGAATREAATAALSGPLGQDQTLAVELWTAEGALAAAAYPSGAPVERAAFGRRRPRGAGVGPVRVERGVAFYDVVAPVKDAAAADGARGWLVTRRRLSSARAAETLSGLIAHDARLRLGNTAGGGWTDLSSPVPPPLGDRPVAADMATVVVDGERRLGAASPVPNTPWVVWVDMPRNAALRPAHDFLRRLLGTAFVLLLGGAVATYGLSRRVSRPLEQLTAAAEGLAGGDLDREVPVRRRDEVGRLARAFDRMRHQIADAQHRLEHRVEERTNDLRAALERLHEAQAELVRQERLAILGQLASGVGHELRNPLAVMTNALYYLDMVLEESTPEVQEYLGILRHEIGLSEKIVGDLLDFARIKPPEREELSLPSLAQQQLERLDLPEGLDVAREFPADLPPAYGDPVQVGQIVLNLITNAVQAMESSGGTLTLRGRSASPGAVQLEVRDSGPGVPDELREQVFEPLFTTKARGIGLGLAVSRTLAEANAGSLTLAGPSGGGAAFVLSLQRAPAEEAR